MKTKFFAKVCFTLLLCARISPAFAVDHGAGNGGDGVILDESTQVPYLLDLVEADMHTAPFFDEGVALSPQIDALIDQTELKYLDKSPLILVKQKLSELHAKSPTAALAIGITARLLRWKLVDLSLNDIKDEDTVLSFPKGKLVQLAVRKNGVVRIDHALWSKMDDGNRAALIFHEAIYAIAFNSHKAETSAKSAKLRNYVGFIFDRSFATGYEDFYAKTEVFGILPHQSYPENDSSEFAKLGFNYTSGAEVVKNKYTYELEYEKYLAAEARASYKVTTYASNTFWTVDDVVRVSQVSSPLGQSIQSGKAQDFAKLCIPNDRKVGHDKVSDFSSSTRTKFLSKVITPKIERNVVKFELSSNDVIWSYGAKDVTLGKAVSTLAPSNWFDGAVVTMPSSSACSERLISELNELNK